jgi:hypothetical protein
MVCASFDVSLECLQGSADGKGSSLTLAPTSDRRELGRGDRTSTRSPLLINPRLFAITLHLSFPFEHAMWTLDMS